MCYLMSTKGPKQDSKNGYLMSTKVPKQESKNMLLNVNQRAYTG
jgi:hypothetical protein